MLILSQHPEAHPIKPKANVQALLKMLMDEGQEHVCSFWAPVGTNDAQKRRLVQQLTALDSACPQGLQAYLRNAKRLLQEAQDGANPYEGCTVSVPEGAMPSFDDCRLSQILTQIH